MTSNKRIDIELLKRIMIEVERRASTDHSGSPVMTNDDNFTDQDCPADSQIDRLNLNESPNAESVERRSRETEHLEILGKVLQRVFKYFHDYHLVLLFLQYQLCSPLSAYLDLCLLSYILEFLFFFFLLNAYGTILESSQCTN